MDVDTQAHTLCSVTSILTHAHPHFHLNVTRTCSHTHTLPHTHTPTHTHLLTHKHSLSHTMAAALFFPNPPSTENQLNPPNQSSNKLELADSEKTCFGPVVNMKVQCCCSNTEKLRILSGFSLLSSS